MPGCRTTTRRCGVEATLAARFSSVRTRTSCPPGPTRWTRRSAGTARLTGGGVVLSNRITPAESRLPTDVLFAVIGMPGTGSIPAPSQGVTVWPVIVAKHEALALAAVWNTFKEIAVPPVPTVGSGSL